VNARNFQSQRVFCSLGRSGLDENQ
jgi:hypothetical protein